MKRIICFIVLSSMMLACCYGCAKRPENVPTGSAGTIGSGDESTSYGDSLDDMNAYDGFFEDEKADVTVTCVSGTEGCYTLDDNVLTFTSVSEDSVYSISGQLKGNIVIDIGDDYKFELEMQGLSLVCDTTNPITVLSGDKVSLTSKNGFKNYIYDTRDVLDSDEESVHAAAVYSKVDLEICGKGELTLISENNKGIHTKDDLKVKNLTLLVCCKDNALKGNDSVKITGGLLTLIATQGDGIKTSNSGISSKGKQKGTVTISGGEISIYAACDGIDAAYDVVIDNDSTVLHIYTDRYSSYSEEVTAVDGDNYYIRFTSKSYYYSVKYYNSDDDYLWVNANYHSTVSGGRANYYYYSFEKKTEYDKLQFFIYSSADQQGQEEEYLVMSDYLERNDDYDTFALSQQGKSLRYEWTNYSTSLSGGIGGFGGMGGMNDGNTDKGDHSTKGVKAGNAVVIDGGTLFIKSYDDCVHADQGTTLENGETSVGDVTINGGIITVYSNDDGIHADNTVTVTGGNVCVTNSYEGLEGQRVRISGGDISVIASDDGINGTATSGNAIEISDGTVYICCSGDGLDSNSRTAYEGIIFSGGKVVVLSDSFNNSAIDTEAGYTYTGGTVLAMMPSRGMSSEATHCNNFSSIATKKSLNLNSGDFVTVSVDGKTVVTVQMPWNLSAVVIYLGSRSANISTGGSNTGLDANGVFWNESKVSI